MGEPPRSDTIQHAAIGTLLQSNGTPNNAARFQGALDEVRVWSSARSQAEIRGDINDELATPPTGLVARWPMSEGGGTTVGDAVTSPAATNGSIIGAGAARASGSPFNVILDTTAPAAPTGLTATAGDASVGLSWTASTATDLAGYRVYRATLAGVSTAGAALSGPDPITGTAYTDASAVNDTTYYYVVVAVDTSGNPSAASNEVDATPEVAVAVSHALDLSGGYVTFGPASGLGTSTFTIETWFRRDGAGTPAATSGGAGGVSAIPLVAKGRGEVDDPPNQNMNWFLGIEAGTGVLAADFEDTAVGANHPIVGTTVISAGWHHAAATYDGTTWRLYLDGVIEAEETENATPEATSIQHASLGTALDSTGLDQGRFDGALDEVRVWNVARSAAQIDSTKNVELTSGPGLLARWGMNETSTSVPSSVGSVHGTIVGAATRIAGAPMPADPVLVGAGDIAVCGQNDDEATAALLDAIPGTVFTVGDNVYESGTAAEFTNCYHPSWGRHKARTMPAPGNHDYATAGAAGYFGYFGAAAGDPSLGYYAYDRGTWRMYSLNSEISGAAMAAQATWLRTDLETNPDMNVMAYFHKPLFSSAVVHGNDPVSRPLWDVLYEFGAEIIVVGHDHSYERFAPQSPTGVADPNGIRQFVAGTGGRSHYALGTLKANSQVFDSTRFGVLKFTLHEHSYSWEFIPTTAGFTDSGVASTVDPVGDPAPAAPTGFAGAASDDSATLTWDPNGEADLAGYNLYRGLTTPNPATDMPLNGGTLLTTTAYSDVGLVNGTTYRYIVTAVDAADQESVPSSEVVVTPFEPTPHAIDFDGTNDHVTFGAAPELGLNTFTIEAWVRRDGTGVGIADVSGGLPDSVPLITKGRTEGETPATNMNWFVGLDETTGVLQADFEDKAASAAHPISGTTPLAIGSWYHVAVTYNGTAWSLYINGTLDKTEVENATPENASTQHAALATAMTTTGAPLGRFAGVLDEVRIWNAARTQAQIQATMGNEIESATGLVARWGMNEGTGTEVGNSIASGSDGTTSGAPAWVPGTPFVSDANAAPSTPTSPSPADGSTGVSVSPGLSVNVSDPDGDPVTTSFFGRPVVASPGEDFTVVVIPDTQHYVDSANFPTFTRQTEWIRDNVDDLNVVFVSHLGDITENFNTIELEWQRANTSMLVLDDAGVPNNMAPGNHDMSTSGENFSFYDQYFPPSRYNMPSKPWYGGWLGEEAGQTQRLNKDNYELFSAGGIDFLVVHLEIDMPTYATAWANEIIDRYPDRTVIISTHAFLNTSNARGTSTITGRSSGQTASTVWNNLVAPNCNVRFVVNGHYPGEGRLTSNNSCGQPVHQLLTDYQSRPAGGNGWLRYYTFKPSENKVYAYTYSPTLGTFETDASSQFTVDFAMAGTTPFQALGSVTGPSGSTATITWPGRAPATQYEWYASVTDGSLTTTGPTSTFTTGTPMSNNPPVVTSPGDQTHPEGSVVDVAVAATDPDGDGLTWSASGLPAGLSINQFTGHITGTIALTAAAGSPYNVTVNVSDGRGPAVPSSFTWTVTNVNGEPTFDQDVLDRTNPEGTLVSLDAGATDPDGDPLTYAATNLPAGLSINASTGLITGTIAFTAAASSPYAVSVTVRDGATVDATDTLTWTVTNVNGPPTFDQDVPNRTDLENAAINLDAGATDPDGDQLTYAATNLPGGLSISSTTGLITGTIAFTAAPGPYAVSVTVTDSIGPGPDATDTFSWTVTNVNREPTFDQDLPNRTDPEGTAINLDAGATDPDGDALTYAASNLPAGLGINPGTGLISGTIAFTAAPGPYAVSVTVTDGIGPGPDATDTFSWTVTDATPSAAPVFRSASYATNNAIVTTLVVPRPATYATGDLLLASVAIRGSSAGTPPAGWTLIRDDANGANLRHVSWWKIATAAEPATYTFTFSAGRLAAGAIHAYGGVDPTNPIDVSSGSVNASSTSLTALGVTTTAANDRLVAFYSTAISPTVTPPAGMTERGEQAGTAPSRLTVIEGSDQALGAAGATGNRVATASAATISLGQLIALRASGGAPPVNNEPTFDQDLPNRTDPEGTAVNLDAGATDPDGDALTYAASNLPGGLSINTTTGLITGTINSSAAASSPYAVSITVRDGATVDATDTFTWTVTDVPAPNQPPTFDQDLANRTDPEGTAINLDAGATDPDGDPLTYAASNLPAGLGINPGTGLISGTIAFTAAPGPYAVSVTVTDGIGPGPDATDTFSWTVTDATPSAAPVFRSASYATNNAIVTTLVVPRPATYATGDLLLASVAIRGSSAGTPPAGWTLIRDDANGANLRHVSWWKIATAAEPATYTFTFSAGRLAAGAIHAYGGVDPTNPIDVSSGSVNASSTSLTALGVTTTAANDRLVAFYSTAISPTVTPPAGMTERGEQAGTAPSRLTVIEGSDQALGAAGATGNRVATASAATISLGQLIALRASGGAPPVNNEPTFDQDLPNRTDPEGTAVNLDAGATDPDGDALTYAASNLPGGLSINTTTGLITGTINSSAAASSPYAVSITVRDGATVDATDTFTWTVTDVPAPNQPPTFDQDLANRTDPEGTAINLDAGATDPDGDPLTYAASNLPAGLGINPGTGLISGTIAFTAAPGPYAVSVTVTDGIGPGPDATDTFSWTVTDATPSAAPVFRSASYATNNAIVTTLVVPRPATYATGDLLLASVAIRGSSAGTPPAGWTLIRDDANGANLRHVSWWKIATAAEPATYTFTFSAGRLAAGAIHAYGGVDPTNPIDVSSGSVNASSTSLTALGVTTTAANDRLVAFYSTAISPTVTPPAGMTERGEQAGTAPSRLTVIEGSDQALGAAGATGNRVATASAATISLGQLIALRAAP